MATGQKTLNTGRGLYLRGPADDVTLRQYGTCDICRSFGDTFYVTAPATVVCIRALMHYESPVAFEGSGMGEHEDHKVPQCPLVSYPPVLMYSGGIAIIMGVVLRGEMELTGSPIFCPGQHLKTVTKIKTVKSVCPVLP